ncbi:16S rRNA (cytosine(967)-C(5))-methyltransferase RsmB [Chitinivibrio alkaliphilus]|uniref:16S rRNA (cytosine(967)-C(5))-methyltransferase n=1 Tax=Chitinivibrio alkaliphilus ACht1 TaxID=1313304 RepID=U7D8Y0_9BACT|nr:16S rRNA (cytosine(967)-C(5))-methyltransferase RsmB [Chitinivibrio alkaliphilus]ERP30850.1 16S rRNA methyltransferase B [Chitinivibrio alkaliphilus ACht1]
MKQRSKQTLDARRAAFRILEHFFLEKKELEKAVNAVFSQTHLSEKDTRLAYEIVQGTLRRQQYLDQIIFRYLHAKFKNEEKVLIILRIALYQMLFLDRVPNYSAVDEAVKMTKTICSFGLSRVVNGVLRNIEKDKKDRLADVEKDMSPLERLSVKYSHPVELVQRWEARLGRPKTVKLLKFNARKPDIFVRRTMALTAEATFRTEIASVAATSRGQGYKNLYYRLKPGVRPIELDVFLGGHCTVQAPSSGWVVALLDIAEGDRIYDMCAAPGGKTTLMADLCGETGHVYAGDLQWKRLELLRENTKRLRQRQVSSIALDASVGGVSRLFNKILVDAPCSGTGVMHRYPDGRFFKGVDDIYTMAERQKKILATAAASLAPGGILVYSTCSLEDEENTGVIEAFLQEHHDFTLERAHPYVDSQYCTSKGYLSITPYTHGMDGIFAARLRKKDASN